jgi:hypothetical protein
MNRKTTGTYRRNTLFRLGLDQSDKLVLHVAKDIDGLSSEDQLVFISPLPFSLVLIETTDIPGLTFLHWRRPNPV